MPIYAYECATCGKRFEVSAKMSDPAPRRGEDCISDRCQLTKLMSPVAIGSAGIKERGAQTPSAESAPPKPAHSCGFGCKH